MNDLSSLAPGSHLCSFYGDQQELDLGGASFVAAGLALGAQVMYVAEDRSPDQVSTAFTGFGIDAAGAMQADQLMVREFAEAYPTSDLDGLASGFRAESALASARGFTGLWVAGEATPLAELFGSADRLLEWERMATWVQEEALISSVCQYDRRRIPEHQRQALLQEHAGAVPVGEAPQPPARFLATREPWGMRVVGEVDMANADRFMAAVAARLSVDPRVVLDASELRFMDVGTIRRLVTLAASGRPDAQVSLLRPPPLLVRMLDLGFRHHPGLEVQP